MVWFTMNSPAVDLLHECETEPCRGRIIALLLHVGRLLSEQNDIVAALDSLLDYMRREMGMARGMISLLHRESGHVFVYRSMGMTPSEQDRGVYHVGEGITGKVVESAEPIIVRKIGSEPAFLNRTGSLALERDKDMSFICVPIRHGRKVLGAISASRLYRTESALQQHVNVLSVMAQMLAHAVELYLVENIDKVEWEKRTRLLLSDLKERFHPSNMIGISRPMQDVYELIRKVSATRTTVLLLGESGVGKEMVANALHYGGLAPGGPFVKCNCAALPESIVESELFGHEKGSFTGAVFRKGRFEEADGGTIFLDEVGELPLGVQAKLLRLLQERCFERVGGNRSIAVNIRIVAATNRDLAEMVAAGTFREDLFYRLNVFPIMIPPLRERGDDVVALAEHFAAHYASETEKNLTGISPAALNLLMRHTWPGNVRELENVIERAVLLTRGNSLNLHLNVRQSRLLPTLNEDSALRSSMAQLLHPTTPENDEEERQRIVQVLRETNGIVAGPRGAATRLGMKRTTLLSRMQRLGISVREVL